MDRRCVCAWRVSMRNRRRRPDANRLRHPTKGRVMRITRPFVGCLNLFASGLLRLLRIDTRHAQTHRLSIDELRAMVLEESHFLPYPHRRILLNLFDLEHTSVDDVMTPRTRI